MTNVFVENITTEVEIEAGYDLFEVVIEDFDQAEIRRYAEEAAESASEALDSEEAAADSAAAALASEQSAAADAAQTASDRIVTTANRNQTTADAAATGADRVAVAADRAITTANAATSTTQAGIATTKANEASASASNALSSANTATTQAGIATTKAAQASASEIAAGNSATSASNSASSATNSANTATSQAGIATTQAGIATTQAGIATTKANEASASAAAALASETDAETAASTATTQAGIATTQAGIATTKANEASTSAANALTSANTATTQAGIATTQAGNALTSANNAAASAVAAANSASQAAQVGTSTTLLGYTVGANTAILAADSILQAFQKTQGQINARVSGTIATGQIAFGTAANTVGGNASFIFDSTNVNLGVGTSTAASIDPTITSVVIRDSGVKVLDSKTGVLAFQTNDGSFIGTFADSVTGEIYSISENASGSAFGIGFLTSTISGTNRAERWRITNTGILQSNGEQTIRTSTGNLNLATAAGNGNILLTPNGTGVVSTLNNVGIGVNTLFAGSGPILTNTLTSGGSGYVDGTYVDVASSAVSVTIGVGALFTIVVSGGIVTTATLTWAGSSYRVGDTLTVSNTLLGGSGSGLVITVNTVESSQLTIAGNEGADITLYRNDASLVTGDNLGTIKWQNRDTSAKASGYSAEIGAFAVGAAGAANLSFFTSNGSGSALTEGFRLTNLSNLHIGTFTADSGQRLQVRGTSLFTEDMVVNGVNIGTGGGAVATNTRVGSTAGASNTTGANNSFFGVQAGNRNTTASLNSFFGVNAGFLNTTGGSNSFFGFGAGQNNTTGEGNSFFGQLAGRFIADGTTALTIANNSVFVGASTRAAADNQTNQIVIGHTAIGLGSNTTVLGNSSTTFGRWFGNLLLGTSTNGASPLRVVGLPTSATGLSAGDVWSDGGILKIA